MTPDINGGSDFDLDCLDPNFYVPMPVDPSRIKARLICIDKAKYERIKALVGELDVLLNGGELDVLLNGGE